MKGKVYYLDKRAREQVEELKGLKRYGIEGVFAVRFKDYRKTWVFTKPETVKNKVESDFVSDFSF